MTNQTKTSQRIQMTADEFMQLPESNLPHELIEGELIMAPSPEFVHQDCVVQLLVVLKDLLQGRGKLLIAPMDVHIDNYNVVQPDLLWLSPDTRCTIDRFVFGAPEFVAEVLSRSTARRDYQDKFRLYDQHGVDEYWIVDPIGQHVEQFTRQDGHLAHTLTVTRTEKLTSAILGVELPIERIFPTSTQS